MSKDKKEVTPEVAELTESLMDQLRRGNAGNGPAGEKPTADDILDMIRDKTTDWSKRKET